MKTLIFNANKSILISIAACICMFGSACVLAQPSCLTPGSAAKKINVKIDAVTQLPYFFDKIDCVSPPVHPGMGSVCLDVNVKPDLKFMLTGAGAADWEFVEFQLSGDGVNWPGTLPPGAYSDFQFDSDAGLQIGKPFVKIVGATMKVQNNNCHEFLVYYRIVLKNNAVPPLFIRLHPVMDNRGEN